MKESLNPNPYELPQKVESKPVQSNNCSINGDNDSAPQFLYVKYFACFLALNFYIYNSRSFELLYYGTLILNTMLSAGFISYVIRVRSKLTENVTPVYIIFMILPAVFVSLLVWYLANRC